MASQLAGQVRQPAHRNLHSCDNCRKEKKKCIFSLPWNPEEQNPPCDRCGRKGRTCAGPVYIPRKSRSAVNAGDDEHTQRDTEASDQRVEERQRNPSSSPPPLPAGRRRVLQPWVPAYAASSEEDDPDRRDVLIELGDILASREVVRLYLYICEDVATWYPQCTIVQKVQSDLERVKKSLESEFERSAKRAYADEEIRERYSADFHSITERFENPPQRPNKRTVTELNTSNNPSSFFAQLRNESFARRRRDGVYSVSDHLCHDVCTTMYSGVSTSYFSLDLPRLLPTAVRAIAKSIGEVKVSHNDEMLLYLPSPTHASNSQSGTQPFPLAHLTLLQSDEAILRRYIQKDPNLKHFFDIDLIGGTVSHLAAHLGRAGNLDLAFHDHSEKLIMSRVKPDIFGLYPHIIAGCRNNLDELKFYVKHGANLNAMDKDGHTCLDLSAQMGSTSVIKWLLQSGFACCSYGNPIKRAVEYKQLDVLDVFIKHYNEHDHHNYQDVTDAADYAEFWAAPGSVDEGRWRTISTALRDLSSNRPSYRAMILSSMSNMEYADAAPMSILDSTPGSATPYSMSINQLSYETPYLNFLDQVTPPMYGPGGPSQQPGYG